MGFQIDLYLQTQRLDKDWVKSRDITWIGLQ